MALIPSLFGNQIFLDPFLTDIWAPLAAFSNSGDTSTVANVRIEEGRVLQIIGERSKEEEKKDYRWDRWHRVKRTRDKFLRRFRLPPNAKLNEVKAGMEDGVLTVTVPMAEAKSVEISS